MLSFNLKMYPSGNFVTFLFSVLMSEIILLFLSHMPKPEFLKYMLENTRFWGCNLQTCERKINTIVIFSINYLKCLLLLLNILNI